MGLVRLLLAVSVIMSHTGAPYEFAGGRIAVEIFYMISGFLISYILNKDNNYRSIIKFYKARILRIFPMYYAIAAFMIVLFVLERHRLAEFGALPFGLRVLMTTVNFTVLGQDWTNFIDSPPGQPPLHKFLLDPPTWTLGVELSFYLIAPFIIRRRLILIGILFASLSLRAFAWRYGLFQDPWSYRFFPFELAFFAAGALAHQCITPWAEAPSRRWLVVPMTVAALILAGSAMALPSIEPLRTGAIALFFVVALPFVFQFQRERRWDAMVGDLSYPIYLAHWPVAMVVLEVLARSGGSRPQGYPLMLPLIVTVIAVAAAVLMEAMIGRPIDRIRAKLKTR